ncbi:MAG: hypothetical protein KatS3mg061_2552 [Dehalococcoidia bacterium]|nr:MAG: hypothetical protein KatS3mg061_2552 [Dehalococcoidia bacterium]
MGLLVPLALLLPLPWAMFRLSQTEPSLEWFWLLLAFVLALGVGGLFTYWALAALFLRYELSERALTIRWGFAHQVIPLERITGVVPGAALPPPARANGIHWPGYLVGRAVVNGLGPVLVYACYRRPADLLYVQTPAATYAIAPADLPAFQEALTARLAPMPSVASSGPLTVRSLRLQLETIRYSGPLRLALLHDGIALAVMALALLGNVALFGYVFAYYPTLPDLLPLHFNLLGEVDFIGPRQDVFRLPGIALGLLLANLVLASVLYQRERLAAYVVLATALLIQGVFWVATTRIVY